MKIISIFFGLLLNIIRHEKKKIFFFISSTLLCTFLLFPFDDLSDFITMKISESTQDNVYLQFDGLSFSLLPLFGIKMNNVIVESSYAPTVKIKKLNIAPHITSLITGRPGGKIKALGLFDGNINVQFSPSKKLKMDEPEMGIGIDIRKIKLSRLSNFLKETYQFPFSLSGETNIESKLHIDFPRFREQPKGKFKIHIEKLKIPQSKIPLTHNMTFPIPSLKLNEVTFIAEINNKKLNIIEGKIGDKKNNFHGTLTGNIFLDFQPRGRLKSGGYNLKVNLNVNNTLKEQLIFSLLDNYEGIGEKYKFDNLTGIRYSMEISADSFQSLPKISSF